MRRISRSGAAAIALLLAAAACSSTTVIESAGGSDASVDTTADTTTETTTDAPSTTTETAPADTDDDTGGGGDPAEAPTSGENTEPRFRVQGELPLSTSDINSLIDFIEEDTGREFLRPPSIVAQSTNAFVEGLDEDVIEIEEGAEISVRTLQSLGLTTQGVAEVTQAFTDLLTSPDGIQGYYDPETDELYVPNDALADDDFRGLLVHELTHALDGQHVDLNVLDVLVEEAEVSGNWEPVIALQAVAEGRASSVQNRWMRENDVVPQVPDDLGAIESVPPALVLALSVPYAFGEQYVEANGGAAGTWELLESPPAASEEFMVFGGISPDQTIIEVPAPQADGEILDQTVFGAVDLFNWLLGESLEPDPALIFPTFTAVDGWAGGTSVMWGDDTQTCTRIALAADSANDLAEIESAVNLWAEAGAGRGVQNDGDLLTVTSCAPFVP